jgi:uncharacterized protein YeaO (DUF488 family)
MARAKHNIQIKRVYDGLGRDDGAVFLVDRMWPRGIKKVALSSVTWVRDSAPSAALRQWFGHEPARWPDFQRRYRAELQKNISACEPILQAMRKGDVTLLFAAKDPDRNNAVVLKKFLEEKGRG